MCRSGCRDAAHKQARGDQHGHTIRARLPGPPDGRPPGARASRDESSRQAIKLRRCRWLGQTRRPWAAVLARVRAAGGHLKALKIASVASAAATTWSTLVKITDSVYEVMYGMRWR